MGEETDSFSTASIPRTHLQNLGFLDLDRVETSLGAIAEHLRRIQFEKKFLFRLVQAAAVSADPDLSLKQFEGMLDHHPEPLEFCRQIQEEGRISSLTYLLGAAPALASWIAHNPDFFSQPLPSSTNDLLATDRFDNLRGDILKESDSREAVRRLRRFRRGESYRIACFDLLTRDSLLAVLEATSRLADFVLTCLLDLLRRSSGESSGDFAVIALGKLGGQELNFSSDIDLIYISSDQADQAAMIRLARRFTRHLVDSSAEGRLYRTDLRLRPMGRTGEVVYPLGAYRQYFETHADTFDRLAMLKSRFVAGDAELGGRFQKLVNGFVYRKYQDAAAIDEVRWLKRRSDARLSAREKQQNIKLGTGGIREVEFFVQCLQLLYGGRDPELRSQGTLPTLFRLKDQGYISATDHQKLEEGYHFLRRVENLLQLDSDLQVQSLPQHDRARLRLSRLLGFSRVGQFEDELSRQVERIHGVFGSLFASRHDGELRDLVLNPGLEKEAAQEILSQAGVDDGGTVFSVLRTLAEASAYPVSASKMRTLLARVLPNLLQHASRSGEPAAFLARFDRLCERLGPRAHLYQSLIETPDFAHRLYRVLLLGEALSLRLIRYSEVVDLLSKPPPNDIRLRSLPVSDPERSPVELATCLRDYKEREELKLALHVIRQPSEARLRAHLTEMAEKILCFVFNYLLIRRPELEGSDLTLIALGKLGGSELTFHSDLDLMLIYRATDPEMAPMYDDLVRDLKRILEGHFTGPCTYRLDFRLRPEGRKSAPATPLESLRAYCRNRVQLWERLAYTRGRPIFAQGQPIDWHGILGSPQNQLSAEHLREVLRLRSRKQSEKAGPGLFHLKLAPGGMFDLQLGIELELLRHGFNEPESRRALTRLSGDALLTPTQTSILGDALELYQRLETALRLTTATSSSTLEGDARRIDQIAGLCGVHGGQELLERCRWSSREVKKWFQQVFRVE